MSVAFGWLLPGGAYLLRKRYGRFALCFFLVSIAFAAGVALDGLSDPTQPGVYGAVSTIAKSLAGGPFLIARIFSHARLPIDAPPHDYGGALLIAAGMINLLALGDRD